MALNAQICGCRIGYEVLVLCPVCPVAAQALQRYVIVPRIPHLVSQWMGRVFLPVMTCPAQINNRRLPEEIEIVGCMRIMTGAALSILYRLMLRQGFVLASDGIMVATAADGYHISLDKPLLLGCVRIMAAQTPLF